MKAKNTGIRLEILFKVVYMYYNYLYTTPERVRLAVRVDSPFDAMQRYVSPSDPPVLLAVME